MGLKPAEFWDMHPIEFWWMVEARTPPKTYAGMREAELDDLLEFHHEAVRANG